MGHPGFYRGRRDHLRVPVNLDPVRARQPGGLDDAFSFLSHSEPLLVGQAKRSQLNGVGLLLGLT
jgi:hypothetical protein